MSVMISNNSAFDASKSIKHEYLNLNIRETLDFGDAEVFPVFPAKKLKIFEAKAFIFKAPVCI